MVMRPNWSLAGSVDRPGPAPPHRPDGRFLFGRTVDSCCVSPHASIAATTALVNMIDPIALDGLVGREVDGDASLARLPDEQFGECHIGSNFGRPCEPDRELGGGLSVSTPASDAPGRGEAGGSLVRD